VLKKEDLPIEGKPVRGLIIDLRDNPGGDDALGAALH
jgi:C-terminal processing protease CtpA/Prc